ncbi:hypothetical protein [Paraburkholderia youngii]|uniref:hypothetical protein n=1 Tax=Paraburkholderia youngii TaxID=2782701 RepID=UPI00159201CF|nr:hypothetical protein [Paraburkholderia youngii]
MEIVTEVGSSRCRVFHLGLANGRPDGQPALTEVKALRSHRQPGSPVKWYVYVDAQGCQHACFSWSPRADGTSIWEEELVLGTCAF